MSDLQQSFPGLYAHHTRRHFLGRVGLGLAGIGALSNPVAAVSNLAGEKGPRRLAPGDLDPVPRKPLNAPTEKQEGEYFTPLNPAKKIGFALVGLGNLTLGELLPAFGECKYAKPVALVSGDAAKAAKVAGQYGISEKSIYSYQTFDRIRDNKDVDVVYIVLPNSMHHEFTLRAAAAGKHVLCEKPMANSVKECEEMIEACRKADRKLMIAYRIQYEPHNRLMKKWIRDKEHGQVKLIESFNGQHIGDPSQWRLKKALSGGGAMPDIGIYCLNTCRFLLGEEPESVLATLHATKGDERFREVEETVMFQLRFPGGALANCTTTYGAHANRRYRVFTDKGAWFGLDPAFDYHGLKAELSKVENGMEWKRSPSMPDQSQFALEMDHMAWCILHDKKPYTPGEEGLQDCRIIEAVYRSANEGRAVSLAKHNGTDLFRGTEPKEEK